MGFDLDRFRGADLHPRTIEVKVPELKDWFPEGEEPIFHVRGMTGEEFYNVRQAVQKRTDLQGIAQRLMSGDGGAIAEAVEEFYGAVPEEFARRVEILIFGCVDPKLDRQSAMKFYKNFPVQAHSVADAILRASGEGSVLGESKGSGGTLASAMTSTSATCEENASSKSDQTSSRKKR